MKSVILFLLLPLYGFGGTYTVSTTADGTTTVPLTLREAITKADSLGGGTINVPAGTYILTMGSIVLGNQAETIDIIGAGPGSTIIEVVSSNPDRMFTINPLGNVPSVQVSIQG